VQFASKRKGGKNRYVCEHIECFNSNRSFGRRSDWARHMRKHGSERIGCPIGGCGKVFYRLDKCVDHQRKVHKMTYGESEAVCVFVASCGT